MSRNSERYLLRSRRPNEQPEGDHPCRQEPEVGFDIQQEGSTNTPGPEPDLGMAM
jgi:hypothetical protein